ncbi:MAG: hypothetical protein V1736_04095 [Pseudomonadota bacterium]
MIIADELLEIVDRNGNVNGTAPRSLVHDNPALVHKVVHVLVFHEDGRLLLQKRSRNKDVALPETCISKPSAPKNL